MIGYLGIFRIIFKVLVEFYWLGVQVDVWWFCRLCDICQWIILKGRIVKVLLGQMFIIEVFFKCVVVDLVGFIQLVISKGNCYILIVVDFVICYFEVVVLKGIEIEMVVEVFVDIFCRIGVFKEMFIDMGLQFILELMVEVSWLLFMCQLIMIYYYLMCNGLVECFNGILKQIF